LRFFVVVFILIAAPPLFAQDADALETYRLQPICLRTATTLELTAVPGFSQRVASAVLRVLAARPTATLHDVADSLCLSLPQRLMLLSCTTLDCHPGLASTAIASVRASGRLSSPRGVREDVWAGAATDNTERIDIRHGQQRLVLVRGSAAGEDGADAWYGGAADVQVSSIRAVLGNVAPSYGCGLVMGSAANTMGPWTVALDQRGARAVIRPWTSSMRHGYLQGVAVEAQATTALRLAAAYGGNTLPTSVENIDGQNFVRSIDRTALRRTPLERSRERTREVVAGALAEWSHGGIVVGGALWHWQYNMPLNTASSWALQGYGGLAASLYGQMELAGVLRWELSRSPTADVAMAAQWWQPAAPTRWMAAARWIGADYRAPYGAAFTDASTVANEVGLTVGCALRRSGWRIDAVADVRRTLTRTYFVPGIVRGHTADVQALRSLRGGNQIGLRLFYEGETDGVRGADSGRSITAHRQRLRARASATLRASMPLTITARLDGAGAWWDAVKGPQIGSALSVGVRYRGSWWWAGVQWTAFGSEGSDATVYLGEVAVPGTIRSVALAGQGQRLLCLLRTSISAWLDASVAYTQHMRHDVATLGTGWDALTGPIDRRLMVQMSVRLRAQGGPRYDHIHQVDDEAATWLE
jgi:hypothetical protein